MFIGRKQELSFLESRYSQSSGELIIVYGRRRIGKTETLLQFCKDKNAVFFPCTECADATQLQRFSQTLMQKAVPGSGFILNFSDWESAFRTFVHTSSSDQKKRILVLDEFPYMVKGNPEIPSILQNLWDHEFKNQNIMVILCGSSISFIEKELLGQKNPLYGRATGIYKMEPMNFYDAIQFFPGYSDLDKVYLYSVLGGVPHYLNQFDPDLGLYDNILTRILTKGSALFSETEFLLHQELRESAIYNDILGAVASGCTRVNDISQKALIENTAKTSVYLNNLQDLGLIRREFSVDAGPKQKANKNRGSYRLADQFFRFWYAFCQPQFTALIDHRSDGILQYIIKPGLHQYSSYIFEEICHQFVNKLSDMGKLPFWVAKIGRWTGKTTIRCKDDPDGYHTAETEIDLLGISFDGSQYLVGECKFKNAPFSWSEYLDLKMKLLPLQSSHEFYYILFSQSGFDEKVLAQANQNDHLFLYSLHEIVHPELLEDKND
ncbi:ATP-binding protein [Erysipelotrichaceae bacterium 51-3]